MLELFDFRTAMSGLIFTEDESLIDLVLEGIEIDGQPIVDLFYLSEFYDGLKFDFGGGVMGISCRDVVVSTNMDKNVLRDQLGLRPTKQNGTICEQVLQLCLDEVKRAGYLF